MNSHGCRDLSRYEDDGVNRPVKRCGCGWQLLPGQRRCVSCASKKRAERFVASIIAALAIAFAIWMVSVLSGCSSAPPQIYADGEIVVARNWTRHPEVEGRAVKVVGYGWRRIRGSEYQGNALRVYEVEGPDGERYAAQEFQLRRIKP